MRRLLVLLLPAVLLASACGGGPTGIPAERAEELAARAERVAELIDAGQGCEAIEAADSLRAAARQDRDAGRISGAVAGEIDETAAAIIERATCGEETPAPATTAPTGPPSPSPEPEPTTGPPGDDDGDDDGNGPVVDPPVEDPPPGDGPPTDTPGADDGGGDDDGGDGEDDGDDGEDDG